MAAFHFQMEGQIQTGKQRTVTQGIPLRIFLRPILLKGDIGDSQPGTRGECAEIVRAAGRSGRAAKFLCSMQDSSLCGLEDCSSAPSYAVGRAAAPAGHRRPRACPRRIALFFPRSFLDRAWKGQECLDSQIAFCLESRYNENPRNPLGGT